MASEAEAKTKWCPFARVVPGSGDADNFNLTGSTPVYNRAQVNGSDIAILPRAGYCIGSACMAWRWSDAKRTAAFLEAVQAHMKSVPNPNFAKSTQVVYAERGREFEQTEGYCGLAGAAQ